MGMFGPYSSASALLEALNAPHSPHVGVPTDETRWKTVGSLEISKDLAYWARLLDKDKHGWFNYVVLAGVFPKTLDPDVCIKLMPSTNMAPDLQGKMAQALSVSELEDVAAEAMRRGTPVKKFRVYCIGPHPEAFEQMIEVGEQFSAEDAKKESPDLNRVHAKGGEFKRRVTEFKSDRIVLGWLEFDILVEDNPHGAAKVHVGRTSVGKSVARWSGGSVVNSAETPDHVTSADFSKLKKGIGPSNRIDHLAVTLFNYYMAKVWESLEIYPKRADSATVKLEAALDAERKNYDLARGKTSYETPPDDKPDPAAVASKVIPSVRSGGGDPPFDVVSANPDDRFLITDYFGTYKQKNAPVDQRDLSFVPASHVAAILKNNSYFAQVGLYFDNPLVSPKLNEQVWWYSNRNLLEAAAKKYGLYTGDTCHLVLLIFDKARKKGKNLRISLHELKTRIDNGSREFHNEIRRLEDSIKNQNAAGKRWFNFYLKTNYKVDISKLPKEKQNIPDQIKSMRNPYKEATPEGFSKEMWNEFVRTTRGHLTKYMGLNIGAAADKKLMYSRDQIASEIRKTAHKDLKGEEKEPWALYLIQYLLAHAPSETTASYTYMVPVNIIRSKSAEIPPMDYSRVRPHHYKEWMTKYHSKFQYFTRTQDWVYIPAHPSQGFPYARMIRPTIVKDQKVLDHINKQLPAGVQMTHRGYRLDGVEYDSFTMLVAMPPSVADKKFGLLAKNQMARQLITDPTLLSRLRKGQKSLRQGTLGDLDLFSSPMTFVGAGAYHPDDKDKAAVTLRTRESLPTFAPVARGMIPNKTELTPEYFTNALGEVWRPRIEAHIDTVGNDVRAQISGYTHLNSPEQRAAKLEEIMDTLSLKAKETELILNQYLQYVTSLVSAYKNKNQDEISKDIREYVQFVRMQVTSGSATTVVVPQIVKALPLNTYDAPFGSIMYRTQVMKIKAPSADVAKMLIMYRLLRRSVLNRKVGKIMAATAYGLRSPLFPDRNALYLAQWAAAGFPIVKQEDTRTRTVWQEKRVFPKEFEHKRSQKYGAHATARMLRVD